MVGRGLRGRGAYLLLLSVWGLDWSDLLAAVGLCLIIEGIVPFASPNSIRRALALLVTLDNSRVRWIGVVSMAGGLVVLYLARH